MFVRFFFVVVSNIFVTVEGITELYSFIRKHAVRKSGLKTVLSVLIRLFALDFYHVIVNI